MVVKSNFCSDVSLAYMDTGKTTSGYSVVMKQSDVILLPSLRNSEVPPLQTTKIPSVDDPALLRLGCARRQGSISSYGSRGYILLMHADYIVTTFMTGVSYKSLPVTLSDTIYIRLLRRGHLIL